MSGADEQAETLKPAQTHAFCKGKRRGKLSLLLLRDLRKEFTMFIAMAFLCFLGVMLFSGIINASYSIRHTLDVYFEENALPDMWVSVPSAFSHSDLQFLKNIAGVRSLQMRASVTAELFIDQDVKVALDIYDGAFNLNRPYLVSGRLPTVGTHSECIVDDSFAMSRGLKIGDTLVLLINNKRVKMKIVGTCFCPEYLSRTHNGVKDSQNFGFVMTYASVLPEFRYNNVLYTLKNDMDKKSIYSEILRKIPSASVVFRDDIFDVYMAESYPDIYLTISIVLPLFIFITAVMIEIMTVNRLINSHRRQIGVLKALGFAESRIILLYLMFAIIPTAMGCFSGMIIGPISLYSLLMQFFTSDFAVPHPLSSSMPAHIYLVCSLPVLFVAAICLLSLKRVMHKCGAVLLSQPVPVSGRSSLLENSKVVWRGLGVKGRMVCRNISRNRKRALMSMFGVFVCNLIIISALGTNESIIASGYEQYHNIMDFDLKISINNTDVTTAKRYRSRIPADEVTGVMEIPATIVYKNETEIYPLRVMEDPQSVIHFKNIDGNNDEDLPSEGVCATRKTAEALGFGKGDIIQIDLVGDSAPFPVKVTKISDFHGEQGLYMSENAWRRSRNGLFDPNYLYIRNMDKTFRDLIDHGMLDEATGIETVEAFFDAWNSNLIPVTRVVNIIIISALLLCFLVCFNLGTISYIERRREYAMLHVVGFFPSEIVIITVSEGMLISVIGILLGMIPVEWLTSLILQLVNTKYYMLSAYLSLSSYCIGSAITFILALIIQLLLAGKAVRTDFLESFKDME